MIKMSNVLPAGVSASKIISWSHARHGLRGFFRGMGFILKAVDSGAFCYAGKDFDKHNLGGGRRAHESTLTKKMVLIR